ncbi:MAG: putative Tfp pilus assembly protein PilN, partial [Pseudomonadota bacterium]
MIRINLLPHREAARRRRLESFYATVGGFAVIGVVVSGLLYVLLDMQLTAQNQTNQLLQNEIKRIEGQIKDVATVQAELATLRARQQAVESLQTQRNQPVRLLNELVRQ